MSIRITSIRIDSELDHAIHEHCAQKCLEILNEESLTITDHHYICLKINTLSAELQAAFKRVDFSLNASLVMSLDLSLLQEKLKKIAGQRLNYTTDICMDNQNWRDKTSLQIHHYKFKLKKRNYSGPACSATADRSRRLPLNASPHSSRRLPVAVRG
ncbi:MAG TPA: hypothetical protein VGJ00_08950 [Rhabdochlamydiaceae bacterium]|jgi:hypothetical protein